MMKVIDRQFDAAGFKLLVQLRAERQQRVQLDVAAQIEMRHGLLGFGQTCAAMVLRIPSEADFFETATFVHLA